MKLCKYIILVFCFACVTMLSQPTFTSIDSLLIKNFEAINLQDSSYYMSLINQPGIFKDKKFKSKRDSLEILKPFAEAYLDIIDELKDLSGSEDIEVKYDGYNPLNSREFNSTVTGKIIVHVKLIINNTFSVQIPFAIMAYNGVYAIETPLMIMFVDN